MTKQDSESKKNYSNIHFDSVKIKTVEELIKDKGWKEIIVEGHKDLIKKYKKKAKDVLGGMKIVVDKITKQEKNK